MILKSETRYYDKEKGKYTLPLCAFDTERLVVTDVDEKTGKVKENSFYSVYIRRHVPYVMDKYPERFRKLVNERKIYAYLLDLEDKAKEAEFSQLEKWLQSDRDYQIAVEEDDFFARVRIYNALENQAKEIIMDTMIYV